MSRSILGGNTVKPLTPCQDKVLADLRRTEGLNVRADQVDLKAALDTLVNRNLALGHSYKTKEGRVYVYEPVQALPEAFVPWPYKLYTLPVEEVRRAA